MDEKLLQRVGFCGLHCGKCYAFADGDLHKAAVALKENLGNFEPYAKRFATSFDPVFENYDAFKVMLDFFAAADCKGCRETKCALFKTCQVRPCALEKHVAFCCECPEFPCDHSGMEGPLHDRWVSINQRIRDIGAESYYEEIKDQPRY